MKKSYTWVLTLMDASGNPSGDTWAFSTFRQAEKYQDKMIKQYEGYIELTDDDFTIERLELNPNINSACND